MVIVVVVVAAACEDKLVRGSYLFGWIPGCLYLEEGLLVWRPWQGLATADSMG